jgi:hypothetical protein
MSQELIKLAEAYAWHSVHGAETNGESVIGARDALHEAIESLQAERDHTMQDSQHWSDRYQAMNKELKHVISERDALAAKLATLEADAERLDWLQAQGFAGLGWVARNSTTGRGYRLHQDAAGCVRVRNAIDAAKGGQHEDA